ncbi:Carboxymuconolactone decarboxylase family protein [Aquisphaera giovannonii]|uniref:Carboxymuconolactone decarboxylase family protein n=1 Tax=Aquisphaera giovannonii TaxID=406548 RepID=A0A5B9WGH1_9BACT|nr:carboxymuconolactone decarboxylase family protein [Aquisphaera giovannonii]QEH38940.1 Carboxymuconolactone decarboxylase family protein [Aquisphaera giovannonii]
MAHIHLPEGAPGIIGPMAAYPETQRPLNDLAEALLRGPSSLTPGERETIAAYVSRGNECHFCCQSHAAAARAHLGPQKSLVDEVLADVAGSPASPKLKALLAIADKVRRDGRLVQAADVARARAEGADDKAIHDTVLIAAAFCMFNRYVEGLGTWAPQDPADYVESGERLAHHGYAKFDFSHIRGEWAASTAGRGHGS